jgi:hypothetical protein
MADKQKNLGRKQAYELPPLEVPPEPSPDSMSFRLSEVTRMAPVDSDATYNDVLAHVSPPPAPPQEGQEPEIRTLFSSRAVLIADLLRDTFSRRFFGRSPYRVLRVDEPGPSTAGGLLARRSISLVAREGSAPSVVCGWVDSAKGEAQLRGYESVALRYQSHHGLELDLAPEHYERFLEDLVEALTSGGIKVRVLVMDEEMAALVRGQTPLQRKPAVRARGGGWGGRLLVLTFVLGLLAGRVVPWAWVDSAVGQAFAPLWAKVSARVGSRP